MSPPGNASDKSAEMRRRAEEALRLKSVTDAPQSSADLSGLVQELQIHQIELEMQIAELIESRAAVEEASARYRDFYDFSPVGYFTLDGMGTIAELNFVGAQLLGFERAQLMGHRLGLFVAEPDRPAFNEILSRVFESRTRQCCEVSLECAGQAPRIVQIEAKLSDDGQTCRAVVLEITKYKRAESELARRVKQQAVVVDLGLRALEGLELQELMDRAVQAIAETLDVELCKVLGLLPTGDKLLLRAGVGWRTGLVGQATVSSGIDSQAGYTLQSQAPVVVTDLRREVRFHGQPLLLEHGVVSGLSVIIFGKDRPFGLLGAHTTRQRFFTEDDTHFVQAVAHVLATAIQRQQTEAAVRKSEASLEAAQASAHLGNWELDLQTQTGSWSREMFGLFDRDPALGPPTFSEFLELVHPEDRPSLVPAQNTTIIAGQTQSIEFRSNPERGPLRYFEATLHAVQQQPDGSVRFTGTCLDITARKQAEEALRNSEQRFRVLVDQAAEALFLHDLDGKLVDVNRSACESLGYSRDELLKMSVSDLETSVPLDELRKIWGELQTSGPVTASGRHRRKDGAEFPVEVRVGFIESERSRLILALARDVTDRQQFEESLRESYEFNKQIIATAQEGIVVYDQDMRFVVWNQFMESLTGYSKEQVLGRHPLELFPFLRETGVIAAIERALAGETLASPDAPFSLPATGKSGWTSARRGPLRNAKGEIVGVIGTVHDITERKQAEAERQRLYMELQVALERTKSLSRELLTAQETERSQLARELHDEVGQVLTAVSLKLHHLKSCCGEEPQRELDAGLLLIDNAINEVRNLSLNLRPPMLDLLGLEPTIRWCVDQHRELAGWQVQLDLQLEARLPPSLEITCFRVVQAALTNIARHAKASQVEIEIRHSDLELELVVRDNGVGFDSREMRQRSEQGGSFGLSAMRQRVELAGGTFRIDSSSVQGQGTTIRAFFPLKAAMQ